MAFSHPTKPLTIESTQSHPTSLGRVASLSLTPYSGVQLSCSESKGLFAKHCLDSIFGNHATWLNCKFRKCANTKSCFWLVMRNVPSIKNKYIAVINKIASKEPDVLVVTESRQEHLTNVAISKAAPPGYTFQSQARSRGSSDDNADSKERVVLQYTTMLSTKQNWSPSRLPKLIF